MALRWLLACLAWNAALVAAYALLWRRRKDVAAHVYVHKGAIWSVWLSSWLFFLFYLAMGPMASGLHAALTAPAALARALLSFLGLLGCLYLAYLLVVYPFFASLRPAVSRENLGFHWQLDVYVEDKVMSLVEETPMAPLILLGMGLAEVLKETPDEEWRELLKSLWLHYVPVVTGRRALGLVHLPENAPEFAEADLDLTVRLAMETGKIVDNREDSRRSQNVLALPLMAGGKPVIVFAAHWSRRLPFKCLSNLLIQQFCLIRDQFILAAEVAGERLAYYDNPWIEGDEGG